MSDTLAGQNGRTCPGGRGARRWRTLGIGLVMGLALVLGPLDFGPRDGGRTPVVSPALGQTGAALDGQERLRGNPNAPITLLEFSDFTCGFCLKFFRDTWPRLKAKYVDTGKVRFLYRDYPRANEGPGLDAAIAARCAGDQGRYWDMHDRLFGSGVALRQVEFHRHAEALGLKAEP
ncbi:MAG: DsbA family protein, partial [Nitrospirales bacterium]